MRINETDLEWLMKLHRGQHSTSEKLAQSWTLDQSSLAACFSSALLCALFLQAWDLVSPVATLASQTPLISSGIRVELEERLT
jgi:hypothetical protein